ncbi:hypothetical protein EYW49_09265 [Siculibacillus lacustris]|uniref:Uncharacterized protein n=1 Tax=Siculibacillus lacustris TaxID=1549641 RepID=A0A4Q9VRD2_9HYPH|nr:hypothetical protein [Siculibacillus lacustris]TBW38448.1 hypothetical protein EYW49_09265 [Siculibacillus lacustris]
MQSTAPRPVGSPPPKATRPAGHSEGSAKAQSKVRRDKPGVGPWPAVIVAACLAVAMTGAVLFYGPAGDPGTKASGAQTAQAEPDTILYRSDGAGRLLKMELGQKSTRIQGTVDRNDVPMAAQFGKPGLASVDRVNAIGGAFH